MDLSGLPWWYFELWTLNLGNQVPVFLLKLKTIARPTMTFLPCVIPVYKLFMLHLGCRNSVPHPSYLSDTLSITVFENYSSIACLRHSHWHLVCCNICMSSKVSFMLQCLDAYSASTLYFSLNQLFHIFLNVSQTITLYIFFAFANNFHKKHVHSCYSCTLYLPT